MEYKDTSASVVFDSCTGKSMCSILWSWLGSSDVLLNAVDDVMDDDVDDAVDAAFARRFRPLLDVAIICIQLRRFTIFT